MIEYILPSISLPLSYFIALTYGHGIIDHEMLITKLSCRLSISLDLKDTVFMLDWNSNINREWGNILA